MYSGNENSPVAFLFLVFFFIDSGPLMAFYFDLDCDVGVSLSGGGELKL